MGFDCDGNRAVACGPLSLRKMAKADPLMRHVYLRQLRYARYYPARGRPWRENKTSKTSAFGERAK
jgi:hypothetical protein